MLRETKKDTIRKPLNVGLDLIISNIQNCPRQPLLHPTFWNELEGLRLSLKQSLHHLKSLPESFLTTVLKHDSTKS